MPVGFNPILPCGSSNLQLVLKGLSSLLCSSREGLCLKESETFGTSKMIGVYWEAETGIAEKDRRPNIPRAWQQVLRGWERWGFLGCVGGREGRGRAYFGSCCYSRQKSWWRLSWLSSVGHLTTSSSSASGSNKRTLDVKWRRQTNRRELLAATSPRGRGRANWRTFPKLSGLKDDLI